MPEHRGLRTPCSPFSLWLPALLCTSIEPALERAGARRGPATEHDAVVDTEILVEVGPMDPVAGADDLEVGVLARSAVGQPQIPVDQDGDGTFVICAQVKPGDSRVRRPPAPVAVSQTGLRAPGGGAGAVASNRHRGRTGRSQTRL